MSARPTVRLISMAWGDRYISELFDYALPAVLAPGNLPALAELFECEMVIVTEERWFDRLQSHPVFARVARYCQIELRSIDEFITSPDAYGMALTYALFRGFEELGPAMLDTHLLFFNADFIMADGSLRTVARKIQEGERLILAPSYCVVAEHTAPLLAAQRSDSTNAIAIRPREMAELAIRHRHNTIRGKTVNQRLFSMEWIDQFYWLVDDRTLIARQLPIALAAMRPTKVLTEMRTFWDYGIISEACPGVKPCVLSDSDDFLMIELRKSDTARDQISLGWPTPRQIADRLKTFITKDPVSLARQTLVLHACDLPAGLDEAKAELDSYVESVLRELPTTVSDHLDHPIWTHHYPRFHRARRSYLIGRGLLKEAPGAAERPRDASSEAVPAIPAASWTATRFPRARLGHMARRAFGGIFGLTPYLRPLHPRWTDVQPVLDALAATPRERTLVISSDQLSERLFAKACATHFAIRDFIGQIGANRLFEGTDAKPSCSSNVSQPPLSEEFDLCVCEVNLADLMRLRSLVRHVAPRLRRGGSILVFHLNPAMGEFTDAHALILADALGLDLPCRLHFAGSPLTAKALREFQAAANNLRRRRPVALACGAVQLAHSAVLSRRASKRKLSAAPRPPSTMTSVVIEISIVRHVHPALDRATIGPRPQPVQ